MRKIISVAVCLALFVTAAFLSGCDGGKSAGSRDSNAVSIVGEWTAKVDISGSVRAALETVNTKMPEYIPVEGIAADVTFTFSEDGSFTASVAQSALKKKLEALEKNVPDGVYKYLESAIAAHNLDMTPEELCLENDSMTLEEEAQDFIAKWDLSRFLEKKSGSYKLDGDQLYLSLATGDIMSDSVYTVDLGAEETKVTAFSKDNDGIYTVKDMLPLTFTKKQ